jgi:hypothetical protein
MVKKTKTKKTTAKKTPKRLPPGAPGHRTPEKVSPPKTTALPTNPGGAVVGGSDPCICGHAPEEHGRDSVYTSSTSCVVCVDDECVAYEADPGAGA